MKYQINEHKARKAIAEYEGEDGDTEEAMPVEAEEEAMIEETSAAPAGLMSRKEGDV